MSAKIRASRRRAFLDELARTGNQTLSAERAKVSRSWVQLHRSTDAEFDLACRDAIAAARARLEALASLHAPALARALFGLAKMISNSISKIICLSDIHGPP